MHKKNDLKIVKLNTNVEFISPSIQTTCFCRIIHSCIHTHFMSVLYNDTTKWLPNMDGDVKRGKGRYTALQELCWVSTRSPVCRGVCCVNVGWGWGNLFRCWQTPASVNLTLHHLSIKPDSTWVEPQTCCNRDATASSNHCALFLFHLDYTCLWVYTGGPYDLIKQYYTSGSRVVSGYHHGCSAASHSKNID